MMLRNLAIANCILSALPFAQTPVQPVTEPAFEVASIKPNTSASGGSRTSGTAGQLLITNRSLKDLICMAYGVQEFQISGPEWLASVRFDIAAKIPQGSDRDQLPAMMKSLLTERFSLAIHRETKEGRAYALIGAKSGPKLQQVKPGGATLNIDGHNASTQIHGEGISMSALAETLSRIVQYPVADQTGLPGVYNLDLKFTSDQSADAADLAAGPTIDTALQEQLGLKLQSAKLPIEMIVVDRVERVPTEN